MPKCCHTRAILTGPQKPLSPKAQSFASEALPEILSLLSDSQTRQRRDADTVTQRERHTADREQQDRLWKEQREVGREVETKDSPQAPQED